MENMKALSVLDGRYSSKVDELRDIFSEHGLIRYRFITEMHWLKFLLLELHLDTLDATEMEKIDQLFVSFTEESSRRVKAIEATTNHDVKALEYFIKEELDKLGLSKIKEWVHFSCTSEDINNCAYALMMKAGTQLLAHMYGELLTDLEEKAIKYKAMPMMSRTHGQPASPTTMGKEFINFAWRIKNELDILQKVKIFAKINGATGNYNAHYFVYPEIDWIAAGQKFLSEYLGVEPLLFTTQINPNASISETMHAFVRLASILIDLDRDMWGYISLGYFKQRLKEGEVGSSTMPHKVNPIDFENSEGNLGVAISLMEHLGVKLQNSRFQRDLTDSTVLRNLGSVYGYSLIAIKSTLKGLGKLEISQTKMEEDLNSNWELLAEPIQTMMRIYKESSPYEKLKALTRGVKITEGRLHEFIDTLESVTPEGKDRMKGLTPSSYVGLAQQLVDQYFLTK